MSDAEVAARDLLYRADTDGWDRLGWTAPRIEKPLMLGLAGMNELNHDVSESPISSSSGFARCFASSFGRHHVL
jgi:hypothetical protein